MLLTAPATAAVAMDQCDKGNFAEGIPPLEKKLRDARFNPAQTLMTR